MPSSPVQREESLSKLLSPIVAAAAPSVLAVAIFTGRSILTHRLGFAFLVFNLFLAWMPLGFAVTGELIRLRGHRRVWLVPVLGLWLMFLPNAPYILTDLVHLWRPSGFVFWYDLAMVLAFALAGVMAGVASMRVVHRTISSLAGPTLGPTVGYVTMIGAAMLSGVGIYVGRVLRWNSWDLIVRPHVLLPRFASAALQPWNNRHAVVFSMLFGLLFAVIYLLTTRRRNANESL